jgi:hypothetical protein
MPIFHNCFGDFPNLPELNQKQNLDRFFYACMGWLIRNPFYNWLHSEYINDFPSVDINKRQQALKKGSLSAAEFFQDKRFLSLPETFIESYKQLEQTKDKFFKLKTAWEKLREKL